LLDLVRHVVSPLVGACIKQCFWLKHHPTFLIILVGCFSAENYLRVGIFFI